MPKRPCDDREPDNTDEAESVLREALGDDVVDEIQNMNEQTDGATDEPA